MGKPISWILDKSLKTSLKEQKEASTLTAVDSAWEYTEAQHKCLARTRPLDRGQPRVWGAQQECLAWEAHGPTQGHLWFVDTKQVLSISLWRTWNKYKLGAPGISISHA